MPAQTKISVPKNVLKKAIENFKKNPGGFKNLELEPGTYLGVITKARGVTVKGAPQIVVDITVGGEVDDSIRGGTIPLFFSFDENRINFLFQFLALFDVNLDTIDEEDALSEALATIVADRHVVRFQCTNNGEYTNYRIKKVLAGMDADEVLGGAGDAGEETAGASAAEEPEAETAEAPAPAARKPGRPPGSKNKPKPEEEPTEEAAEEEAPADSKEVVEEVTEEAEEEQTKLQIGMKVTASINGAKHKAKVVSIDYDAQKVVVESATDKKKYRMGLDKLSPA